MAQIKFNVAQLLREVIGSRREYELHEACLPLDDTLNLRDIAGQVRFTRTATGVFAHVHVTGLVRLVCVRSLDEFDQAVSLSFEDQFHSVIDVVTGITLPRPDEDDPYFISDNHMVDLGQAIREYTLLELPLNPVSEAYRDSPVRYTVESEDENASTVDDEPIDARLQALKAWNSRANNNSS
jgi:uncharacterized protein